MYGFPHNTTEELRRDFDSIDADGDGFLDFDEMLWDTPRLSVGTYRRVAELIDKDDGGFISAWEMKAFMATLFPGKCNKYLQKDKN